jgi:hypothetical protein
MDASLRDRFRTTAMHNTVVVNGRSQSEPQGPFHWRTTTDAHAPVWVSNETFDYIEGNHDAYAPVAHSRSVFAVHGFGWIVIDHLLGDGATTAAAYWHLHPSWIALDENGRTTLRQPDGLALTIASTLPLEILGPGTAGGLGAYSPVYGRIERSTCLRARVSGTLPLTFATFVASDRCLKDRGTATAAITPVEIARTPPDGWHGAAFKVTAAGCEALVLAAVERTPPHGTAARPGALWGTSSVRTDARAALSYLSGAPELTILIEGSHLENAGRLVRA